MTSKQMTPAERFAAMNAMPTHVLYMTRGGRYALITQSYCEVIADTDEALTIRTVEDVRTIPKADVFAVKDGRLTVAEVDAVFAEHRLKQSRG
jgi:hypothetical protein